MATKRYNIHIGIPSRANIRTGLSSPLKRLPNPPKKPFWERVKPPFLYNEKICWTSLKIQSYVRECLPLRKPQKR